MTQDKAVDRLSDEETARASAMLDLFAPLSISSAWEPSERRTIVRAMLAYGDAVAGITHTIRDRLAAPPTLSEDLREAAQAQEDAEDGRKDCSDCDGEGMWEHCSSCSLTFGRAIDLRRAALVRAQGPV